MTSLLLSNEIIAALWFFFLGVTNKCHTISIKIHKNKSEDHFSVDFFLKTLKSFKENLLLQVFLKSINISLKVSISDYISQRNVKKITRQGSCQRTHFSCRFSIICQIIYKLNVTRETLSLVEVWLNVNFNTFMLNYKVNTFFRN